MRHSSVNCVNELCSVIFGTRKWFVAKSDFSVAFKSGIVWCLRKMHISDLWMQIWQQSWALGNNLYQQVFLRGSVIKLFSTLHSGNRKIQKLGKNAITFDFKSQLDYVLISFQLQALWWGSTCKIFASKQYYGLLTFHQGITLNANYDGARPKNLSIWAIKVQVIE